MIDRNRRNRWIHISHPIIRPFQLQIVDHAQIFFVRPTRGGEVIAYEATGGADVKDPALQVAEILLTAAADLQIDARQDQTHDSDDLEDFQRTQRLFFFERRAGDRVKEIQGRHVGIEFLEAKGQADAVIDRFPHAEDAAAAGLQADFLSQSDSVHTFLPGVRRHDIRKMLARGFQVVIDAANAGRLEVTGLVLVELAKRRAMADAIDFFHGMDRFHDLGPFFFRRASAAVDQAKGAGAAIVSVLTSQGHFLAAHHRMRSDARIKMSALRAELAILATVAKFCRQDAAKGNFVAVEVAAHLVTGVEEVVNFFAANVEFEQVASFVASDFAAVDDAPRQGKGINGGHAKNSLERQLPQKSRKGTKRLSRIK